MGGRYGESLEPRAAPARRSAADDGGEGEVDLGIELDLTEINEADSGAGF